jgi:hypothetical protein
MHFSSTRNQNLTSKNYEFYHRTDISKFYIFVIRTKKHPMRKIYTFISIFIISSSAIFAQVLPNADFEAWTNTPASFPASAYDNPNSWNTLNSTTAGLGQITCYKETTAGGFHGGAAALKLVTKSIFGQVANGIATTGTINTASQTIGGGIAYTGRPDSIVGFYKYTSVTGDNGFVELQLLGAGGDTDTVGYVRFVTPSSSVNNYTRFAAAVVYRNSNAVAKSIVICSSSKDATTHFAGSTIWVDDLLVTNPFAGIEEPTKLDFVIWPNPASDYVVVKNPAMKKMSLEMFDITGRKIKAQNIYNAVNTIEVSSLPEGIYIYAISDDSKKLIRTGKLTIQK